MLNYFHVLTLVFVVAKLAGWITWSWWIVLAPSILFASVGLLVLVGVLAMVLFDGNER